MEGIYRVMCGNEAVGQVRVTRQGLFYTIDCNCKLVDDRKYILEAETERARVNLGLMYPRGAGNAGLYTTVSGKVIGQGSVTFFAKLQEEIGSYIPLDKPLNTHILQHILDYRCCVLEGKTGLVKRSEKNS